jgi:hypothetical protein
MRGDKTLWPVWEDKWNALLAFTGLPRWHHTDFVAKRFKKHGVVSSWPYAEWLVARKMLCEAFEAINPIFFGSTVLRADYVDLRTRYTSLPEDPYYFLLDRCFHRLIQGLFEHPIDEGIAVYCDQDKDETLVRNLASWHTAYLRANQTLSLAHPDSAAREIITSYGSNVRFIPLQAADVAANELMNFARAHPDMPTIAINHGTDSWILERLKARSPWMVMCYSKPILEMELDGRAWVPGQWPGYRFVRPPGE